MQEKQFNVDIIDIRTFHITELHTTAVQSLVRCINKKLDNGNEVLCIFLM